MFRSREMGSKRGSLPPKEGDLTCMLMLWKLRTTTLSDLMVCFGLWFVGHSGEDVAR